MLKDQLLASPARGEASAKQVLSNYSECYLTGPYEYSPPIFAI